MRVLRTMSDASFQSLFNSHQLELKRAAAGGGSSSNQDSKQVIHDDPWGINAASQVSTEAVRSLSARLRTVRC